MSEVVYEHDCGVCIYLDSEVLENKDGVDIYVCPQGDIPYYIRPEGGIPTIVIRYSNEPSDYASYNMILLENNSYYHDIESLRIARKYYALAEERLHNG